jgi:hypothetical protein
MMDRRKILTGWRRAARKFYAKHPQPYQKVVKFTPDEVEQMERYRQRPTGSLVGVGVEFGRLFVWERVDKRFWWCVCACGDFTKIAARTLIGGRKTDCGCLKRECERVNRFREAA